jgi:hypothetical protein
LRTSHFGIYGLVRAGDLLLTVRKARGPYVGWLDLPGGTPDAGFFGKRYCVAAPLEDVAALEWLDITTAATRSDLSMPLWHVLFSQECYALPQELLR